MRHPIQVMDGFEMFVTYTGRGGGGLRDSGKEWDPPNILLNNHMTPMQGKMHEKSTIAGRC